MGIIDNNMAREIAKEEAKQQLSCKHQFETRHIELLDEDVEICKDCDINKKLYLLMQSTPCFGQHHWYSKKCWQCPCELLCEVKH